MKKNKKRIIAPTKELIINQGMQKYASACISIAFGMRSHCVCIDLPQLKINLADYQ